MIENRWPMGHDSFENGQNPADALVGAACIVGSQQIAQIIKFVQNLLKPQLINLMNHDEQ